MGLNSTHATGRRTRSSLVVVTCVALTVIAANSQAQSAQPPPEPGTQRIASAPSLAGPAVPTAAKQSSVATVPAASKPATPRPDPYFAERPQPAAVAASLAAGILVVVLIMAGILLTVRGLREDMRNRKRRYRPRSRRVDARSTRPPSAPTA